MSEENQEKSIFGMEATVSQNAAGIMRILVLMRMDEMLRCMESYENAVEGSGEQRRLGLKTTNSIRSLLRLLRARMVSKSKYEEPYKKSEEAQAEAIDLIMAYLEDDLKLTKIDTRQEYNRKSWEQSIKAKS